jgi:hypothetical protein
MSLAFTLLATASVVHARDLTLDERVAAQKAIEQVYWNHRIWPKENPGPKPPLSAVMPDAAIRTKVDDYLRMSELLGSFWHQPITAEQLQTELTRMSRETKAPGTLRELFAALHNDPVLIAECLARPTLARRRVEAAFTGDARIHGARRAELAAKLIGVDNLAAFDHVSGEHAEIKYVLDGGAAAVKRAAVDPADRTIHLNRTEWDQEIARLAEALDVRTTHELSALPIGRVSRIAERDDRFVAFAIRAKDATSVTVASVSTPKRSYGDWARETTVAPTLDSKAFLPAVKGYTVPALPLSGCTDDTWTPTMLGANVAAARYHHTAVWTGSEMIVWGGIGAVGYLSTGGRYDPATDSWIASSLTNGSGANAPTARFSHTAIWTGSEMIVWGGYDGVTFLSTGGRYDPAADTWAESALTSGSGANVAPARYFHTAVWTGSEMIVWGGLGFSGTGPLNSGGRYNPSTDSWATSSLTTATGANVPQGRYLHTTVWTGSEMIVWGGLNSGTFTNTGGRYDPATDSWAASSLTTGSGSNVADRRYLHTAIWTGSEMIIWGGVSDKGYIHSGGRYDPSTDSWATSSLTSGSGPNVPEGRYSHTAVWVDTEMIVWGGTSSTAILNTGGRYSPATDSWAASSLNTGSGANVPNARQDYTVIWTGTEMIVWGGSASGGGVINTGGRYNPATDTWSGISGVGDPQARYDHTAVWTGHVMIVWGGYNGLFNGVLADGGRYDPALETWTATSVASVATARRLHTAVWTGSQMIVWGGLGVIGTLDIGGAYSLGQTVDDDGDGFSECAGDCNDGNAAVHPGATEICDGLDNDCDGTPDDGIVPPTGSASLGLAKSGTDTVVSWAPLSGATSYDAVEGSLPSLLGSGGNFQTAVLACVGDNLAETSVTTTTLPAPGSGFWLLVRGSNCAGTGTYDEGSGSQQGSRDAEIAASGLACP